MPWPTEVKNRPDQFYACSVCGATNCQSESWVDINTNEPMDESGSDIWCPECESHDTVLVLVTQEPVPVGTV